VVLVLASFYCMVIYRIILCCMVTSLYGCIFSWLLWMVGRGYGSLRCRFGGKAVVREKNGRSSYLYWLVFVKVVMGLYLE
jgi:hypothetical protein